MSRAKWKGPYIAELKKKGRILNIRKIEITPKHINQNFTVSLEGKKKLKINPTEQMLGLKFGQFSPTRSIYVYKKKKKKKKR